MRSFVFLCGISLCLVGCHRGSQEQACRFHDDGSAMPVVAVTTIYDRNDLGIPWPLATELTHEIRDRLIQSNVLYLSPSGQDVSLEEHIRRGENPFFGDFAWTKTAYPDTEFVAFMELVEHDMHPRPETGAFLEKFTPSYELAVTLRVRVIDLRGAEPHLVLQELIHQTHMMPKPFATIDFANAKWGRRTYSISPLGFAHAALCKEAIMRLQDYIILAKSRSSHAP